MFLLKRLIFLSIVVCIYSCKNDSKSSSDSINTAKKQPKASVTKSSKPLFYKLTKAESGIEFVNKNTETDGMNFYNYEYFYNGGGVAVADFNNDGFQDIYLTANMAINRLFINQGNLNFVDVTRSANVNSGQRDWCTGVTVVDINNDGWQDIFVSRSGWFNNQEEHLLRNLLFVNNGDLTFTERGVEYGFTDLSPTTQSCFFDADNDGDLDVFQINHLTVFKTLEEDKNGKITRIKSPGHEYSDKFYSNNNGKYVDKTKALKLENLSHGLGIVSSDFNNDGWQDFYVANDYSEPDYLYMNQGNGTFKNEMNTAFQHMSKFSMGVDVADINNDGYQDIFNSEMLAKDNFSKKANMAAMSVSNYWKYVNLGLHYQDMHNSLQLNNGNGTFSEISWMANVAETDWSWCPLFADFDNDGYKDLFVSNGYKRDVLAKDAKKIIQDKMNTEGTKKFSEFINLVPTKKISNYIFRNNGDLTFEDKTNNWGLNFDVNSNGAAYADFDNDGDLDLVVNNMNDEVSIYRNDNVDTHNFVDFILIKDNSDAYGSKVEVLDKSFYQVSELNNSRGYQSKSESKIHFGLGKRKTLDSVLVTWPNGKHTVMTNVEINKTHNLIYKNASFVNRNKKQNNKTYFTNSTKQFNLKYKHQESEYDDYKLEVLLPHKLSQEGPFLDVADVNGDGLEDFFVGNGSGSTGELYIQSSSGKFKLSKQNCFIQDALSEDLGVLFFDYNGDSFQDLYVVSGSNEFAANSPQMQDRLYKNDGKGNFVKTDNVLPNMEASGSCVVAADYDNDGDLDLFVGGFLMPNQYPKPGRSFLLENDNGKFVDVTNKMADNLQNIGMVKDAVFADVNSDNKMDLIVTGEWMTVEVFINTGSKFERQTEAYGLSNQVGWWNTLLVQDINKDGFLDIIAGNLGTNSKHKASPNEPFKIFANDFDNSGTNDIVLGYYNEGTLYPVRGKQCSSEQLPDLSNKIKSYNEFGQLNLEQIYGNENLTSATHYDATNFKSSIFINNGGKSFEIKSLPNDVQVAPTKAILDLDVNNDGNLDLILVGNHYPVEVETGRYDAHIGNVLLNNSDAQFKNESLQSTGFFTKRDNRDIKKIKIKGTDYLIVSSNRNGLEFFKLNAKS